MSQHSGTRNTPSVVSPGCRVEGEGSASAGARGAGEARLPAGARARRTACRPPGECGPPAPRAPRDRARSRSRCTRRKRKGSSGSRITSGRRAATSSERHRGVAGGGVREDVGRAAGRQHVRNVRVAAHRHVRTAPDRVEDAHGRRTRRGAGRGELPFQRRGQDLRARSRSRHLAQLADHAQALGHRARIRHPHGDAPRRASGRRARGRSPRRWRSRDPGPARGSSSRSGSFSPPTRALVRTTSLGSTQ